MKQGKTLQIANIFGLLMVLVTNTLAVTLPIGGRTTGEISQYYPNLFVPAGYAFSIWSLIYLLLLLFIIMQAKGLFSSQKSAPKYVHKIGWWFVLSCLANSSWILAWHYLLTGLSVLIMLGILFSLINIYNRLPINYPNQETPLFVRLPFSIYLGWITVATVANVTAFLVSINWNGFGISPVVWTAVMILVATLVGVFMLWQRRDLAFIAVLFWAFTAILVKRQNANVAEESLIITTIYMGFVVLGITVISRFLLKRA